MRVKRDWQEPKDGKLTEKQVTGYIGVLKELVDLHKAAGKAIDKASGPAALAIAMQTGQKYDAIVKKHGLNNAEMNWVSGKVFDAYGGSCRGCNQKRSRPCNRRRSHSEWR